MRKFFFTLYMCTQKVNSGVINSILNGVPFRIFIQMPWLVIAFKFKSSISYTIKSKRKCLYEPVGTLFLSFSNLTNDRKNCFLQFDVRSVRVQLCAPMWLTAFHFKYDWFVIRQDAYLLLEYNKLTLLYYLHVHYFTITTKLARCSYNVTNYPEIPSE